jgi:hypothetical protein
MNTMQRNHLKERVTRAVGLLRQRLKVKYKQPASRYGDEPANIRRARRTLKQYENAKRRRYDAAEAKINRDVHRFTLNAHEALAFSDAQAALKAIKKGEAQAAGRKA